RRQQGQSRPRDNLHSKYVGADLRGRSDSNQHIVFVVGMRVCRYSIFVLAAPPISQLPSRCYEPAPSGERRLQSEQAVEATRRRGEGVVYWCFGARSAIVSSPCCLASRTRLFVGCCPTKARSTGRATLFL